MSADSEQEILPDYINWYLRSKGLTINHGNNPRKIETIEESNKIKKTREQEQTQQLLIALTEELFNQIEELNKSQELTTKKAIPKKKTYSKPGSKIVFTDLSWYRKKLEKK